MLELAVQTADHLIAMGEDDAAADVLQHYVDGYPPSPRVFQRLGRLRLKQGRPEEAARLLEQALATGRGQPTDGDGAVALVAADASLSSSAATAGDAVADDAPDGVNAASQ